VPRRPLEWESVEKLPTEKQQATFKKFLESGGDLSKLEKAAKDSGFSNGKQGAQSTMRAYAAHPAVIAALDNHKVTIDTLVGKLVDLKDAEHPNPNYGKDNAVQHKATVSLLQLADAFPSKKVDVRGQVDHKHQIVITSETMERIQKALPADAEIIDADPI